jgi:glyoxylase-like metal-dependent hydrolase (beta-lactamase superfamily II)
MFIQTKTREGSIGDVHWIEGVVQLRKIKLNVYCFVTEGVLIDTGAPRLLHDFKPFFEKMEIDQVFLTHGHEDHVGGAAFIEHHYQIPIYMDKIGIENSMGKADYPLYRRVFWGKRKPFKAKPIQASMETRLGLWDVIKTPGHSEDHLSFLNREKKQLFSGDLFVQPKTKLLLKDESIPTIIRSLQHVLTFDFEEVFCCHAGYVKNGRSMLEKKLTYLQQLQRQIVELDNQGFHEKEIQTKLFKKRYPITYISFGEWDSIHIIRSVLRETRR